MFTFYSSPIIVDEVITVCIGSIYKLYIIYYSIGHQENKLCKNVSPFKVSDEDEVDGHHNVVQVSVSGTGEDFFHHRWPSAVVAMVSICCCCCYGDRLLLLWFLSAAVAVVTICCCCYGDRLLLQWSVCCFLLICFCIAYRYIII